MLETGSKALSPTEKLALQEEIMLFAQRRGLLFLDPDTLKISKAVTDAYASAMRRGIDDLNVVDLGSNTNDILGTGQHLPMSREMEDLLRIAA